MTVDAGEPVLTRLVLTDGSADRAAARARPRRGDRAYRMAGAAARDHAVEREGPGLAARATELAALTGPAGDGLGREEARRGAGSAASSR